jgi:hypothetical protein
MPAGTTAAEVLGAEAFCRHLTCAGREMSRIDGGGKAVASGRSASGDIAVLLTWAPVSRESAPSRTPAPSGHETCPPGTHCQRALIARTADLQPARWADGRTRPVTWKASGPPSLASSAAGEGLAMGVRERHRQRAVSRNWCARGLRRPMRRGPHSPRRATTRSRPTGSAWRTITSATTAR